MKIIPLTKGKVTLVDDDDFEYLNQWTWFTVESHKTFYAVRTDYPTPSKGVRIWMHKEILRLNDPNLYVDHIDRNGLNNQRSNLREATRSKNMVNRSNFINSKSKFKGVSWDSQRNRWKVYVVNDGVKNFVGRFKSETEAALAYNEACKKIHGEFACLNLI